MKNGYIVFVILLGFVFMGLPHKENISLPIMEGTELETPIHILDSGKRGSTIFIIGGIHGNEVAGIEAAEAFQQEIPLKGRLILLPRANKVACAQQKRTVYYLQDLNRVFPGKVPGTDTQILAKEIVEAIEKYQPEMVLDLHESVDDHKKGENALGNSLIFSPSSEGIELVMYLLEKINHEASEGAKFTYLSGAPEGSVNREVSTLLDIPVITIETNMQLPMEARVKQHKDIIDLVLQYYGMDE